MMGPFTIGEIPSKPQLINIYENDGETPRDLTGYTTIALIMTGPGETEVDTAGVSVFPPEVGIGADNQIQLQWGAPSAFTAVGAYRYQFSLSVDGKIDYTGVGTFEVNPVSDADAITLWCTIDDVLQMTGYTITQDQLEMAQMIIDNVTARTTDDISRIKARDLKWLRRALAYQAVWMTANPDIFTKTAFSDVAQDGFSGKLFNKSGNYLGPLAERALKNLSWLRTRSLRMYTPFVDGEYSANPLADDLILDWKPM